MTGRMIYPDKIDISWIADIFKDYQWLKINNMKRLFQYAVILHEYETPTGSEASKSPVYKDSRIIIEPKITLAKSEKDLVFKITREIPEEFAQNPDNVEIIIRSF